MVRFFRMYGLEGIFHHSRRNSVLERLCAMWAMNFAHGDSGGSGGNTYEKYSWEGVFASIKAGTYATDYAIGDMIPLDLGSEGLINMQIVAFDADNLADGSGKAPITWAAKELLKTSYRMNPKLVTNDDGTYQEGTGGIGGWEKSELRAYIKDTIKPLIPENVRNGIKEVKKSQNAYDVSGVYFTQTTIDDLWIPSSNPENGYKITDSRKKVDGTSTTYYWFRRLKDKSTMIAAHPYGGTSNVNPADPCGICLCFCT